MSKKVKETSLVLAIEKDSKLSPEEKMEFKSLANLYTANFNENLTKGSVDLSDETGIDLDTWRTFLTYPPIKRIIESFINEQIKKKADSSLLSGTGTRDAINVRKAMLEAESADDNTRYVVFRMPDKVEDLNESS
jgi:hypothetical protein